MKVASPLEGLNKFFHFGMTYFHGLNGRALRGSSAQAGKYYKDLSVLYLSQNVC